MLPDPQVSPGLRRQCPKSIEATLFMWGAAPALQHSCQAGRPIGSDVKGGGWALGRRFLFGKSSAHGLQEQIPIQAFLGFCNLSFCH